MAKGKKKNVPKYYAFATGKFRNVYFIMKTNGWRG
jgi:hypothetical protein